MIMSNSDQTNSAVSVWKSDNNLTKTTIMHPLMSKHLATRQIFYFKILETASFTPTNKSK